jgi:LmbE family N-acetylglucosaminyl deacetylase
MKNVLVIAAHMDDEVLGCGGTMARHIAEGDMVSILFMSYGCQNRLDIPARTKAAKKALEKLGDHVWSCLSQADQLFDKIPLLHLTKMIEEHILFKSANIIYTHHIGDLNKDHELTARAVLTAARPLPESRIEAIYGFEIPSSTEWAPVTPFIPQHHVEFSHDQYMKKTAALEEYKNEMREYPHARSIPAAQWLARLRGGQCGVEYAEAFTVYRSIKHMKGL